MLSRMKLEKSLYQSSLYCAYYTGKIERSQVWVLVSALRGTEHICFDRTRDVQESIFEFFVPLEMEHVFLEVMSYLQRTGVVKSLEKSANRFLNDTQ